MKVIALHLCSRVCFRKKTENLQLFCASCNKHVCTKFVFAIHVHVHDQDYDFLATILCQTQDIESFEGGNNTCSFPYSWKPCELHAVCCICIQYLGHSIFFDSNSRKARSLLAKYLFLVQCPARDYICHQGSSQPDNKQKKKTKQNTRKYTHTHTGVSLRPMSRHTPTCYVILSVSSSNFLHWSIWFCSAGWNNLFPDDILFLMKATWTILPHDILFLGWLDLKSQINSGGFWPVTLSFGIISSWPWSRQLQNDFLKQSAQNWFPDDLFGLLLSATGKVLLLSRFSFIVLSASEKIDSVSFLSLLRFNWFPGGPIVVLNLFLATLLKVVRRFGVTLSLSLPSSSFLSPLLSWTDPPPQKKHSTLGRPRVVRDRFLRTIWIQILLLYDRFVLRWKAEQLWTVLRGWCLIWSGFDKQGLTKIEAIAFNVSHAELNLVFLSGACMQHTA